MKSAALAAALFVVYAIGASRTVYVGDSGELATAVHVLGIPHPSGYPLVRPLGSCQGYSPELHSSLAGVTNRDIGACCYGPGR